MKPLHIRIAAAFPVLVLSAANLPPFVHLWSDVVSDLIGVAAWIALLVAIAVAAPFNRWMLDKERDTGTRMLRAAAFSLGIVVPINAVLVGAAAHASKAMGLHSIANIAVAVVVAVVLTALGVVAFDRLWGWTYHRINAAHAAADRLVRG
ncbi:hypothetical protein [Paraburkholderia dilworthii]|uniref:Uncharacterized protein n=1 Tax=Paraburkholderia dilworthii TaxID=948106 RepID=A0ABW9D6L9_9BURK